MGSYARSTSGVSGLSYLGARAYDPALGRFLQTDPVYGANANAYVYPGDPVGSYDLDGRAKARSCGFWCSVFTTGIGALVGAACAPFAGPVVCGAVGGGITGFARYWWTHHGGHGYTIKGAIKATLVGAAIGGFGGSAGKLIKKLGGKVFKGWGDRQAIKDWEKFKKAIS
ncbi:RHS repeat-associated core domain-containing protein [Streptomyces sp. NPDC005151]